MVDITMPRLSDTMQEGTIARWLKQPGDEVKRGDVLAQIETDKATMDLEAFESGTLQEVLAQEGTTVAIGQPVARLGAGAPPERPEAGTPASQPAPPATPEVMPTEASSEQRGPSPTRPEPVREPVARGAESRPEPELAHPTETGGRNGTAGRVRASPLARRIAAENGLDLAAIAGSGPEGRVIRADVEAALATGPRQAAEAQPEERPQPVIPAAEEDVERVPLTAMRRTVARRMAESTRTVPHFFLTGAVDATELVALRRQVNEQLAAAGDEVKVSLNDLVVKAVAVALRRMPEVNVSYTEEALIRHRRVHVGIAVALDQGLIVPVVRDADRKGLADLARETRELAERARAGKLQPDEYRGGTFSVSNLGMFGVEQFSAVINPPEAGILAVGAVAREPVEYQGQVALRERMRLTLSIDHRALDGATGARFLQLLTRLLEQPLLLLL